MTDDEINQLADWAKQHEDLERRVQILGEQYQKKFESDQKRKKLVEDWDGDGTELYREMQDIMPDKDYEAASDAEMASYFYGERLANRIVNRITSGDTKYHKDGEYGRRRTKEGIDSVRDAHDAVNSGADNIMEIRKLRSDGKSTKQIAKRLKLPERFVDTVSSKSQFNRLDKSDMRNLTRQYELEEGIRYTNKKRVKDSFDKQYIKNTEKELKDLKSKFGLVDPYLVKDTEQLELMYMDPYYKVYKKDIQKQLNY